MNNDPQNTAAAASREDGTPFETASFTDVVEAIERKGEREARRRDEIDAAARALIRDVREFIRRCVEGDVAMTMETAEKSADRLEAAMGDKNKEIKA